MLLVIFTGSLLPYLQCLDSWLYDGILDDPYEEVLKKQLLTFLFWIYFTSIHVMVPKHYKSSLSCLTGLNILNSTVNHQIFIIMLCALKSSTEVYMRSFILFPIFHVYPESWSFPYFHMFCLNKMLCAYSILCSIRLLPVDV